MLADLFGLDAIWAIVIIAVLIFGGAAIPTTGRLSRVPPVEPKKWASPKLKTPPSDAASQ